MRPGNPENWDMAHGEWHPQVTLTPDDIRLIRECLDKRVELKAEAKQCAQDALRIKSSVMKQARELENSAKELRASMLRMVKERQDEARELRKSIPEQMKPLRDRASKLYREATYVSHRALSELMEASEGTIYAIQAMKHWGTR